jgi:GntR family transcriptional regulator
MFTLHPQSGIPIYRQLVDQIRHLVASGQLKPGDELPSVRELALRHTVSPMTVSKAYSLADAEGLLVRQRGKLMAVADQDKRLESKNERLNRLRSVADRTVATAQQLGLSQQDVVRLINEIWKKS